MRPHSSVGFGEEIYKLKKSDKTSFHTPTEKGMSAPTSKRPEEREFVVDSGASMHIKKKKELSSEEMGTVRRFRNPTVVLTASGEGANSRGSTSVRSRSQSVRNRAVTQGNASSPIAWKALRRPRILL